MTPALGKWRKKNHKFKVILSYLVKMRQPWLLILCSNAYHPQSEIMFTFSDPYKKLLKKFRGKRIMRAGLRWGQERSEGMVLTESGVRLNEGGIQVMSGFADWRQDPPGGRTEEQYAGEKASSAAHVSQWQ